MTQEVLVSLGARTLSGFTERHVPYPKMFRVPVR